MEIGKESVVVIYDPADGRIVHRHQHLTPKGEAPPDEREIEKAALEFAAQKNLQTAKLRTLHVDPKKITVGVSYRVDPQKQILVEQTVKK